jgi:hypothetical protein
MVQTIPVTGVTLRDLKQVFGLQLTQNSAFFSEWMEADAVLGGAEQAPAKNENIVLLRRERNHVVIDNDPEIIENWRVEQVLSSVFELPSSHSPDIAPLIKLCCPKSLNRQ